MANTKSAMKRMRQAERRRLRNRAMRSKIRGAIKTARAAEGAARPAAILEAIRTLDKAVTKLAAELQRDAVRHEVGPTAPDMTACTHLFWSVGRDARGATTAAVAQAMGSTMVFTRTRHGADRVGRRCVEDGGLDRRGADVECQDAHTEPLQ